MAATLRALAVLAGLSVLGTTAAGSVPSAPTAARLLAATRAGAWRFAHVQDAVAAGYAPQQAAGPVVHYINHAYLAHGHVLDPQRPEALVYERTPSGMQLVAAMFMVHHADSRPPRVAGLPGGWHTHTTCWGDGGLGVPTPGGSCPAGTEPVTTPEMLHVWLIDVPGGPFAADMSGSLYRCDVGSIADSGGRAKL